MNDEDHKLIEKVEKPDFSTFFNGASPEAQRKLMEDVARKANADQRALLEQYERAHRENRLGRFSRELTHEGMHRPTGLVR